MSSIKYLLTLTMLATLLSSAFAVSCFHCDSDDEPDCAENFDPVGKKYIDCSSELVQALAGSTHEITSCMKLTKKTDHGVSVLRSCDITNNECIAETESTSCYLCQDDLCNSSTSIVPVTVSIVFFFALARIFS